MPKDTNNAEAPKNPNQDVGGIKYVARLAGGIAGIVALALGAMNCITITPKALLAGIWQMLVGFLVLLIEAPCLCICVQCVGKVSEFFDRKKYWVRTILYILISIMPIVLYQGVYIIIGSGFIIATGVGYGVISLGRKGSRDQMKENAASLDSMKDSLISNEKTSVP